MGKRQLLPYLSLALMLGLVAAATAGQTPTRKPMLHAAYFVGNFNTCDLSQWEIFQGPSASFKIVRRPKVEGRCAGAIKIGPWALDGLINKEADGATWYQRPAPYGTNGHSVWQHFSVRFARGFRATPGEWNFIADWHDDKGWQKFPQIKFEYSNLCWLVRTYPSVTGPPRIGMRIMGGLATAPRTVRVNGPVLRTGHWYDFVVRTVWSPDPSRGYVEWWLDGKLLYSRHVATLYTRPDGSLSTVYFMEVNYRRHALWDSTIYYDGTRLGPTRASVRY
jgi:Polysaccharide lyase